MRSLLRTQLRLAGLVLLGARRPGRRAAAAFLLAPGPLPTEVLGMPLSWVLLGFAVYPLLFGLGWLYVRAAERNERDFADLVERSWT